MIMGIGIFYEINKYFDNLYDKTMLEVVIDGIEWKYNVILFIQRIYRH